MLIFGVCTLSSIMSLFYVPPKRRNKLVILLGVKYQKIPSSEKHPPREPENLYYLFIYFKYRN
jgi:hypothetical protein